MYREVKLIKHKNLVSVIIPIYNASQYLANCIASLVYQTYKNIEIICVDDGSTDNSLLILQELEINNFKLCIIHQDNQGAGAARNNGLYHACGKYVIFLDADDCFDNRMIEKLLLQAEKMQSDICICKAFAVRENGKKIEMNYNNSIFKRYKDKCFSAEDIANNLLTSFSVEPWNKLYRRDFLLKLGVKFQQLKKTNDLYFTSVTLLNAKKIVVVDEALVYYRMDNRYKRIEKYDEKLLDFSRALEKTYLYISNKSSLLKYKKVFYEMATGVIFYNLSLPMAICVRKKVIDYLLHTGFFKINITLDNRRHELSMLYRLQYILLEKQFPISIQIAAYRLLKIYEYHAKNGMSATVKKIIKYCR